MKQDEFKRKLILLKKELRNKVFIGAAKAMNFHIRTFFKNHPRGLGKTVKTMRPIEISGTKTTDIITFFPEGYPAILELGSSGSHAGYTYPYNKTFGTYILFRDQPDLQSWAAINAPSMRDNATGLRIGKEGNTYFDKPDNKWFTISSTHLKSSSQTRTEILRELRKINIK